MDGHVNGTPAPTQPPFELSVGTDQGRVRIDFNRSVAWLALDPVQAMQLAQQIMAHSCAITGVSVTMTVGDPQPQAAGPAQ